MLQTNCEGSMSHQYVVIVDAYSTGQYLAPQFKTRGFTCLHVQSTDQIPKIFLDSFHAENFDQQFIFDGATDNLLKQLNNYPILYVVPGTETGVSLADILSERLSLPSNGTQKSIARRNKFVMVETLRAAGIKTVSHHLAQKADDILEWQKQINQFPIVLKPEQSGGSDHVFFCYSEQEIKDAFEKILNNITIFETSNQNVLAQTFLSGTEYILNTMSANGIHYVAEIWRCHKEQVEGAGYISLLEELVPFEPIAYQPISIYAKEILDALGIQHGPGHFEIMLTETGPTLIEVAARMQGCVDPAVIEAAMDGDSFVSLTLDAYLNPEKIKQKASRPYQLKKYIYRVFMKSHVEGILKTVPDITAIKNLSSFASVKTNMQQGMPIYKTKDIASSPGVIHFISSDRSQLQQDYATYRKIEESLWLI